MDSNGNGDPVVAVTEDSLLLLEKETTHAVQVALHIRPLIPLERLQGCKDCITVVPGEPQVQLGTHCFTFDHVYGSTATPSSDIFDECVLPLLEGLFNGYNATVLAYGQTGSGKTYTMGTAYTAGGGTEGIIPQAMEMIFARVESLKDKADFQIRVSFIEILKEEVHDLLDLNPPAIVKSDACNSGGAFGSGAVKSMLPGKLPIQIRETTNGGITLAGVTEVDVRSLQEMASCLEQGSLSRATASTNMNSRSSRSHAIFTITVEQRRKWEFSLGGMTPMEDGGDEFLCAKLHLVDLAGSERAKKTGADGMRFKEGVHINKGLLALGNVISALGDDRKRKEGGHVPYRDSKLTRLLQDSLGGNSKTVMIACVSPADSNAEETLNTLKYANRARNIQNKPTVNRDPIGAEMQRMRQQLELLQAELLCVRATGCPSEDIQVLKQKVTWLEASNSALRAELQQSQDKFHTMSQQLLDAQVERDKLQLRLEKLRNAKDFSELDEEVESQKTNLLQAYLVRIQELESELQEIQASGDQLIDISRPRSILSSINMGNNSSVVSEADYSDIADRDAGALDGTISLLPVITGQRALDDQDQQVSYGFANGRPVDISAEAEAETVAVKELEHNFLRDCLDKELQNLNKQLEQKEAEMRTFAKSDTVVLKQHFERKLVELEEEKRSLQRERDNLFAELEALASSSDEQTQKMQEAYVLKLKDLETQILDLKKKQDNQAQLLRQKQRSDEAAIRLQDEIHRIKQQKVQLQNKIKQESEQFRTWKATREKELLQLRKEGRRNEYEMHKLQALHQRQKLVLQRKTEEAATVTRRLKELLESRRSSSRERMGLTNGVSAQNNEKTLQQWLDHELEVAVRVHEVRTAYEKQRDSRAALAKELAKLKEEDHLRKASPGFSRNDKEGAPRISSSDIQDLSLSPSTRQARICLLESMLSTSSSALVAMASQLSEAEERERNCSGRARWQHVRTLGDAKNLLNFIFNAAVFARCQWRDKEVENRELKEKIGELSEELRLSEVHRKEVEYQQRLKEQAVAVALATAAKVGTDPTLKRGGDDLFKGYSQLGSLGQMQLQYNDKSLNLRSPGTVGYPYDFRKVTAVGHSAGAKQAGSSTGKLWRWKRSHQRWSLHFKWKWQKPWRLSEWIRHGDESLARVRPAKVLNVLEMM
ncbi:hypothetical protein O6H91_21G014700 [Diphasiastrum complanatum]|uniref:Uncharacterized protein n=1 Tax=Diphasiastrum complanatum TaxID=34168 RepID=A0ACC2AJW9_DIPCM|nr:hypothetical protein O6H91_21G014700 [Diphasiastrum complanatum]